MSKKNVSALLKSAGSTSCVETVLYSLLAFVSDRGRQFHSCQLNLLYTVPFSFYFKSFTNSATT